ncbi:sirohydrochlorin cobaltochelatase [Clostridium ganghwense]|uniref:Sirohydrochlorin cobaltochelatase n=1 Tax=Clostridium ganghwense TaxID=312089 RepID=A0ABT4CSX3_9CLOT|nr:sirohydrochlorin cobaltochelatase [Clostridium ganghwense]MCY6372180.1 sirohydrochlorin cobaltochelatase [Clostridium ganghwense]
MKKAILVVSFGTTHKDTLELTIERIEDRVRENFKEYEVRRAFTAHQIIKILKERDGIHEDTPEEALEKLKNEGFEEVIVQPLHLIPGAEFDYVTSVVDKYKEDGIFKKIAMGRPALFYKTAEEHIPDDYQIFTESLEEILTEYKDVVFMGHGSVHPANACYPCLQSVLRDNGYDSVYVGTVEGYPTIYDVVRWIKKDKINKVTLVPLMLVAGDHAKNDMAGDDEDSWKNILKDEGIETDICLRGLGEFKKFQDIYLQHIKDAIEGKYEGLGRTKKGLKRCKK